MKTENSNLLTYSLVILLCLCLNSYMRNTGKNLKILLVLISALFVLTSCGFGLDLTVSTSDLHTETITETTALINAESGQYLPLDGFYTSRDDVALYIYQYGHLPDNFLTKDEAGEIGWEGGSLEQIRPGMRIGGDRFGNYEGLLPAKAGRIYWECDIVSGEVSSRGAQRIVFSNDGLVYYTDDHYASFTLLYGDDKR